jgi:hypothetical protein
MHAYPFAARVRRAICISTGLDPALNLETLTRSSRLGASPPPDDGYTASARPRSQLLQALVNLSPGLTLDRDEDRS